MDAIKGYIEEFGDAFDVSTIFDPDISKFEDAEYTKSLVYKYFPAARREFFERPQLRFTQREYLNDPFELTQRWQEARTDRLRHIFKETLYRALPRMFKDTDLLFDKLKEEFASSGVVLSSEQTFQLRSMLASDTANAFIERQLNETLAIMPSLIDLMFSRVEARFGQIIENVVAKWGLLSLTEEPLSQQMWAHYSGSGNGFVIGLDAQHPFFLSKKEGARRNLLRKIEYTDERVESFWRNPYFLFLVKSQGWSYEREWRLLRELSECDEQKSVGGQIISLCNVPPELVRAVYFGYNYDVEHVKEDASSLIHYGCSSSFYRVQVNHRTGSLEPEPI